MKNMNMTDFVVEELEARFEMEAISGLPSTDMEYYCHDPELED